MKKAIKKILLLTLIILMLLILLILSVAIVSLVFKQDLLNRFSSLLLIITGLVILMEYAFSYIISRGGENSDN